MAAQRHHGIGLARHVDVVGVTAFPAHQNRILAAPHGLADAEFHGGKLVGVMYRYRKILLASKGGRAARRGFPASPNSLTEPRKRPCFRESSAAPPFRL